jgi:hypothetical protein
MSLSAGNFHPWKSIICGSAFLPEKGMLQTVSNRERRLQGLDTPFLPNRHHG